MIAWHTRPPGPRLHRVRQARVNVWTGAGRYQAFDSTLTKRPKGVSPLGVVAVTLLTPALPSVVVVFAAACAMLLAVLAPAQAQANTYADTVRQAGALAMGAHSTVAHDSAPRTNFGRRLGSGICVSVHNHACEIQAGAGGGSGAGSGSGGGR